jgi:hypothetical protein
MGCAIKFLQLLPHDIRPQSMVDGPCPSHRGPLQVIRLVSARDYVPVVAWVVIDGGAVREYYPTWRKSRVGPKLAGVVSSLVEKARVCVR